MALAQPSKLPAAQAARREKMVSLHAAPDPAVVAAEAAAAAAADAARIAAEQAAADDTAARAADPSNQSITLTQAQLDERMEASNRAAELARMEADELRAQLTAAEHARNEQPRVVETPDLGFTATDVVLTADEKELFGGSEEFVVKICRRVFAELIGKYNVALDTRLVAAEQTAGSVAQTLQESNKKRFSAQVMDKAPDVPKLVGHAKFQEFLRSIVPRTDISYNTALNRAHAQENMKAVLEIFDDFRAKIGVSQSSTAGYAGAAGSAAAAEPAPTQSAKRFTMTERKAKSLQLQKGQISKEEFATYKTEFDKALAEDRVDP